ncbi:hypothetical protein BKA56DRAFT_202138 [Ilyonectria sp. MPI-CAGE-AT-0026]|nr:hypothetical protein BKA56DRAFT_202138 [Ilyonectria sp. MPI-CAGE-AT-0026]
MTLTRSTFRASLTTAAHLQAAWPSFALISLSMAFRIGPTCARSLFPSSTRDVSIVQWSSFAKDDAKVLLETFVLTLLDSDEGDERVTSAKETGGVAGARAAIASSSSCARFRSWPICCLVSSNRWLKSHIQFSCPSAASFNSRMVSCWLRMVSLCSLIASFIPWSSARYWPNNSNAPWSVAPPSSVLSLLFPFLMSVAHSTSIFLAFVVVLVAYRLLLFDSFP